MDLIVNSIDYLNALKKTYLKMPRDNDDRIHNHIRDQIADLIIYSDFLDLVDLKKVKR